MHRLLSCVDIKRECGQIIALQQCFLIFTANGPSWPEDELWNLFSCKRQKKGMNKVNKHRPHRSWKLVLLFAVTHWTWSWHATRDVSDAMVVCDKWHVSCAALARSSLVKHTHTHTQRKLIKKQANLLRSSAVRKCPGLNWCNNLSQVVQSGRKVELASAQQSRWWQT